ncbi:hypothetical protein IKG60_00660 [Candidatus Saccharibacteria bacterium]|nr:hypothetical protein [Candidatus Saccharibacteria bacterium]
MGNFNFWTLAIIISVIIMFVVGWNRYGVKKVDGRHRLKISCGEITLCNISLLLSSIIGIMMIYESCRGIVALIDCFCGTNDSEAWSILLVPVFAITAVALLTVLLFGVSIIAGTCKKSLLKQRYCSKQHKRYER